MVHAVRPRGRVPRSRGGSVRACDAGRRVAAVDGWRCSTWVEATTSKSDFRSTCYASASSTLGKPPFAAALFPAHNPPLLLPALLCPIAVRPTTVRVSLTHNSRALFISPSRTPVIRTGRRCCGLSSTLAYFALQSLGTYRFRGRSSFIPQPRKARNFAANFHRDATLIV